MVKLNYQKYEPPFKPQLQSNLDTNNFDEEFTKEGIFLHKIFIERNSNLP